MAQDLYNARKFMLDVLMKERSLDRDALEECEKLSIANQVTLAESLVSEGVVTDQELGHLLDRFASEGHISPAELNLLTKEFPSNWERWMEMEERDEEAASKMDVVEVVEEEAQLMPSEAIIEEIPEPTGKEESAEPEPEKKVGGRPLTERVHRGSLQEALEELMHDAPVKEYPHASAKPEAEKSRLDPLIGRKIGGTQIIGKIGDGQFGSVFKGVVEELGRTVAVRLIRSDMITEARRMRVIELARKAIEIEHRNIAAIIDVGEDEGFIYIISKLIEGETLRAKLQRENKLSQDDALELATHVARALRACHDKEVTHGDIKPENIYIDKRDQVMVADFGLAKSMEIDRDSDSKQSPMLGAPHYMAPEQFEAGKPDARTDVYSLGIVLFEALSGALPFDGATPFAIRDAHMAGKPKLVTEINSDLNPTVAKLIAKMIAKDPEHRYQNMTELVNDMVDLKQYLATGGAEPPIARGGPAGAPELDAEVRARAQRYKTVAITPEEEKKSGFKARHVILILLLIVVAGGAYLYLMRPEWFRLRDTFEEEAANAFAEMKRKTDILIQQQEYFAALQELEEFPARYQASQARRNMEAYRQRIFDDADKNLAPMRQRVQELFDTERVEDARRLNRALKLQVQQILDTYENSWPKVGVLRKYVEFATEIEARITQTLDKLKNFEADMKYAEALLKEDRLAEARAAIEMYKKSPIAKHVAEAQRVAGLIEERKKVLDTEAAKKAELEEFEQVVSAAKEDLQNNEFDKAVARLLPFRTVVEKFENALLAAGSAAKSGRFDEAASQLETFASMEPQEVKIWTSLYEAVADALGEKKGEELALAIEHLESLRYSERQRIKIGLIPVLAEIEQKRRDYLADEAERKRGDEFEKHMDYARDLMSRGKHKDAMDVLSVYASDSRLTPREKKELSQLSTVVSDNLRFLKDFTDIENLFSGISSIKRSRELVEEGKYAEAFQLIGQIYGIGRALTQEEKEALSEVKEGTPELVEKGRYEEVLRVLDEAFKDKPPKNERLFADIYRHLNRSRLNAQANALIEKGGYKEVLDALLEIYGYDPLLTEKERAVLSKLKAGAGSNNELIEVLREVEKLLSGKKLREARTICMSWQFVSYQNLRETASSKYLEIMDALEPDMVYITGGTATLGSDDKDDGNPERIINYPNYYIDRHEVTCAQYEKFVAETEHAPPANWPRGSMPRQWANRPVTGVSWNDAAAYAKWVGKRLPTDAEWEIAASWDGKKKLLYPWGDQYAQGNANIASGDLSDVGAHPKDVSPNGLFDMAGNAFEWTETKAGDKHISYGSSADKTAKSEDARTSRRLFLDSGTANDFHGFRCAKDVK